MRDLAFDPEPSVLPVEDTDAGGFDYSRFFLMSPDGVLIADEDLRFVAVNDVYLAMSGYTREEVLGLAVSDVGADPDPGSMERHRGILLAERHDRFETHHRRKDGSVYDVEVSAFFLQGGRGAYVLFVRDISDRKRLEAALRQAETDSSDLIKYAPTGIYEIDFRGPRFVSVNDAMCRLSGYERDELLAMDPFDLLDDEGRKTFAARIQSSLRGEPGPGEVEYRVRRKDGTWMYVVLNVSFRLDGDGRPTGALVVGHDVTDRRRGADDLSRALETEKQLRLELQRRVALAEALTEIDNRLHMSQDYASTVEAAVGDAAQALGAASACLSLYRDRHFIPMCTYGFSSDIVGMRIPQEHERHSMLALETGQVLAVQDTQTDERVDAAHLESFGIRAVIVVPLVVGGEGTGDLYFNYGEPQVFADEELDFARRLGASLSLALESARLLEDERAIARTNEALTRIDHSIHSTLDRDEMLARVASESAEAIGADGTVLCLKRDGAWIVQYAWGTNLDLVGQAIDSAAAPFIDLAIESEYPVAIDDAFNDPRAHREAQERMGVRSVMLAPLVRHNEVIGGLFFDYLQPHHFTDHDITYAQRLATSVGLAVTNIELYENEREIAHRLQEALLTMPAKVRGLDFAHTYRSASQAARVGGDFYDIFELSYGNVGLTIGDVAGKGVDAAMLTSLAKNTIRAHAAERGKTPAQVLHLANEVFYRTTPDDSFVTVFFGMFDRRDGRLVYSNAGHTAAALVCDEGTVTGLRPTGPLLGAFPDVTFGQAETRMCPGELLFLYTDGLTESWRGREQYGEKRLFDALSAAAGLSAAEVLDSVMADVTAFTGARLQDDIAAVAIRCTDHDKLPISQMKLPI